MDANSRPRIAVTGPEGFVAWHVRCAARARWGGDLVGIGSEDFADEARLDAALADVDAIIHLAGVNRSHDPAEVEHVNPWLAERLVDSLQRSGRPVTIVYGNSIHSRNDSTFGLSKRRAATILTSWGSQSGAPVVDVVMPNIFGEHGRPNYNSVVATFCHSLAGGATPTVVDDKELPLVHVADIADLLLDQALSPTAGTVDVPGRPTMVSDVAARLTDIADGYRSGLLPDLSDPFTRQLFNTYRSATFPADQPIVPHTASDQRGRLVEAVRAAGGQTQVFYSTTKPSSTRGQHYHRRKVERFLVLSGRAEIRLRKLFTAETVTFSVSGEDPVMVDMPTLWVHSLTNTGPDDVLTLFYADELYDAADPDTYPEAV